MNVDSIALSTPLDPPASWGEGPISEIRSYEFSSLPACGDGRGGVGV